LADHAEEVGEEGIDAAGNVEGDNYFLFPGSLDETDTVVTCHYTVFLVEENEVNSGPDSNKGNTNDDQDAGDPKVASAAFSVLGEEDNSESRGNDKAGSKDDSNENVPPVDVIIQKFIEDFEEDEEGNSKDCASDEKYTTSYWEKAAACQVFSFLISALAEAATAHETTVGQFLSNLINRLIVHSFVIGGSSSCALSWLLFTHSFLRHHLRFIGLFRFLGHI
jgi:hypothetical protein